MENPGFVAEAQGGQAEHCHHAYLNMIIMMMMVMMMMMMMEMMMFF